MRVNFLAILLFAGLSGCNRQSPAAEAKSDPAITAEIASGRQMVVELRAMAGQQGDISAAPIWLSHWGGIPGSNLQAAAVAWRDPNGHWRVEQVARMQEGHEAFGKPKVRSAALSDADAAKLDGLLGDKALYAEPAVTPDACTDQGQTIVSIRYRGRTHFATLGGCASNLTATAASMITKGL
ncbi:MAG: hypothetical protein JSR45_01100 [Proteobacteria bacterium]|nr:hypothetical protein [Pseudomonadota bacterium]